MTGDADKERSVLDVRGLNCPLPVLKLRKFMKTLPKEHIVRLVATDPMTRIDVPHFCAESGARLVSADEPEDGLYTFEIAPE